MSNKKKQDYNRPNFWGMIQNVLIASLNKGQFLMAFVGFFFLIMIIKLSPEDTKSLFDDLLSMFKDWHYLGWFLGVFSTSGWYIGTKRIRNIHAREMSRVSREKTTLQQRVTNKKLRSSNR